jgi:L-ascorbate 6-phosphate lactonase
MDAILNYPIRPDQAALWFLGQAGYVFRSGQCCVTIDPYLTDSVAEADASLARMVPVPIQPEELKVDIYIVTHDHLDHLDPRTIDRYPHRDSTVFVAPHLACTKLRSLGVSAGRIVCVDSGRTAIVSGVSIKGIYALGTDGGVIDTAGYLLRFANGRSVYHSSDTGFNELLLDAAPRAEVLLVCINGKWGNLDIPQAVALAGRVKPDVAVPNHYDMMRTNAADPEAFVRLLGKEHPEIDSRILSVMEPFVW